jgi:hypothetical protein
MHSDGEHHGEEVEEVEEEQKGELTSFLCARAQERLLGACALRLSGRSR